MVIRAASIAALVFALVSAGGLVRPASAQAPAPDAGIPIQNALVRAKCGGCHKTDDNARMSRISYRRATPENWELTIKRMVALNGLTLEPTEARAILKYLADNNGLAPAEARDIAFESERRSVDFSYTKDKETAAICSSCHSIGRVLSERRTPEEWGLLVSMHRGYYPLVDTQPMLNGQGFTRTRPVSSSPGPDGKAPDKRNPVDRILEHLSKTYPLSTPAWTSWSTGASPALLSGKWAVSGYAPGRGPLFGELTITSEGETGEFLTESTYTIAKTGESIASTGKAVLYAGYAWRGRQQQAGSSGVWRETLFVERSQREMWGRWFTGAHAETGIDVKLVRIGDMPVVLGVSTPALKTASERVAVRIFGANLPSSIEPADISLGQGVTVQRVVGASPGSIDVEVTVAAEAVSGSRDLSLAGLVLPSAVVVFDRVDYIKVLPEAGLARLGGAVFPKQMAQFEAVGMSYGADGRPGTADDANLGLVKVSWSMEEYAATFGDDDLSYVGELDPVTGLFDPAADGPNPKRSGSRNNVGDVWVVATLAPDPALGTVTPLKARAHLLVTVPVYMQWAPTGVGQ